MIIYRVYDIEYDWEGNTIHNEEFFASKTMAKACLKHWEKLYGKLDRHHVILKKIEVVEAGTKYKKDNMTYTFEGYVDIDDVDEEDKINEFSVEGFKVCEGAEPVRFVKVDKHEGYDSVFYKIKVTTQSLQDAIDQANSILREEILKMGES